jgi:hypothetical protein
MIRQAKNFLDINVSQKMQYLVKPTGHHCTLVGHTLNKCKKTKAQQ